MRTVTPLMYWCAAACCAIVLLLVASRAASDETWERAAGRKQATPAYAASTSPSKAAVFRATNVKPGATGRGRVRVANRGRRPIRLVRLTQDRVATGGIGPALGLQVYDRTTRRCVYPAVKVPKPRRGKPLRRGAALPCRTWGAWKGGRALRNVTLPARTGRVWKPREQHLIEVRWRLDPRSTNADQGRRASFRLLWKFVA